MILEFLLSLPTHFEYIVTTFHYAKIEVLSRIWSRSSFNILTRYNKDELDKYFEEKEKIY